MRVDFYCLVEITGVAPWAEFMLASFSNSVRATLFSVTANADICVCSSRKAKQRTALF